MSHAMVLFLSQYPPFEAFKLFCNVVLTNRFAYKTFSFKEKHIWQTNTMMEQIFAKFFFQSYHQLKVNRIEIWNAIWMEMICSLFAKNFSLKNSLLLFDFFLLKENVWIFRFCYNIFGIIDENFNDMDKNNFVEECKMIILLNQDALIKTALDEATNEVAYRYIDGLHSKMEVGQ
jgi:hypothetical protein